jgi:ribosomal protein S18 acetylase RimI-like enzyme
MHAKEPVCSMKNQSALIIEMTEVTDEIVQAFARLIPQLTSFSEPPSREGLSAMAASDGTAVFLACLDGDEGQIVGTATLALSLSPTGRHAWIEDVVVAEEARHQGLGRALTEACLARARELGLRQVYLTSRPSRAAANQLYQSMGFTQRETNVYRYDLTEGE